MTLRLKAGLLIVAMIIAATAATTAVFAGLQFRFLRNTQAQERARMIAEVRREVDESQLARDPLMLLDALRGLVARHDALYARARVAGEWQDVGAPAAAAAEDADEQVVQDRTGAAAAVVAFSKAAQKAKLEAAVRALARNAARTGGVMVLLGLLLALPLSATLTGRIRRIEAALQQIGGGALTTRLPPLGGDEVGRLASGVNAMAERLGEVENLKRTFVASVTHELRTPLGIIEGYVDRLLSRQPSTISEADRADLQRVRSNARRLSHFVTNLLDYAKIERGKLDYAPRATDVAELVETSVRFFEPKAKESGVSLSVELEPNLSPVRADPELYTHLLTNLLSNALKFTARGGAIMVRLRRQNGGLELSVADTGVGIRREDLGRLFAPFERMANPLHATGVGLGLAISKQIAALHKGELSVASEVGKGSRFTFSIPAASS